jgi:hypothetical protein
MFQASLEIICALWEVHGVRTSSVLIPTSFTLSLILKARWYLISQQTEAEAEMGTCCCPLSHTLKTFVKQYHPSS